MRKFAKLTCVPCAVLFIAAIYNEVKGMGIQSHLEGSSNWFEIIVEEEISDENNEIR